MEFEDSGSDAGELRYVPDRDGIGRNPQMTLPGYDLGTPSIEVVDFPYVTRFGDETTEAFPSYSRVQIEVPVTRPAGTYATKLLLPIIIVLISSYVGTLALIVAFQLS